MSKTVWKTYKYRDLLTKVQNGLYKPAEYYGQGRAFVRMYNLDNSSWVLKLYPLAQVNISEQELVDFALVINDILISRVNSVEMLGKVGLVDESAAGYIFENMLIRLQFSDGVEPQFLVQQMLTNHFRDQVRKAAKRAGGQASISSEDIRNFYISLPPLAEQRKIAAILGTWDAAIATAERLVAALRRRKQALMQRLLTGEVRFPGFEGEWEEKEFSEVLRIEMGGTPSRAKPEYWDIERTTSNRWLAISDLKGKYVSDSAEYISDLGIQKSSTKLFPEKTIVMSFKLTIGRVAILAQPCYTNEAICAFIPKRNNQLLSEYLYHALSVVDYESEIDQTVKGRTLNKEKLNRLRLRVPTLEEQDKIARFLDTLDTQINTQSKQVSRLQAQKRGLMQRLLTGEVRVAGDE